jgi:hypothetical protein
VEEVDPYAALLVSMHTYNLLSARADRSTIAAEKLPMLDDFQERQLASQHRLRNAAESDLRYSNQDISNEAILDNFRLLQACDNLSLLSCVRSMEPATLLHPQRLAGGTCTEVAVEPVAARHFRLHPYPFGQARFTVTVPARHVEGHFFDSSGELAKKYAAAQVEELEVTISA